MFKAFDRILKAYILITLILYSTDVFADPKTDAISHAQNAFFIQSGLQDNVNKFSTYMKNKGKVYVHRFGLENPSKIMLFAYAIYHNKSIQFSINNNNKIELHTNSISYIINL